MPNIIIGKESAFTKGFFFTDQRDFVSISGKTAHWTLDNDDLNGGTVKDITGNGHYGETRGGVTTGVSASTGLGEAFSFDGQDDYVPVRLVLDGANEIGQMTVATWVKIPSTGGGWAVLDFDRSEYFNVIAGGGSSNVNGEEDGIGFGTNDDNNGIDDMTEPVDIRDDNWHHVAAVFDRNASSDKKLYLDGQLIGQKNGHGGNPLGSSSKARYGVIGDGSESTNFDGSRNGSYYEGDIADLRFWDDRALTASEVESLYNETA